MKNVKQKRTADRLTQKSTSVDDQSEVDFTTGVVIQGFANW